MHSHLTNIAAQERIADLRAAAERSTRTASDPLQLADGRRLKIRPIEREDRDRFRRLFTRLTPQSRYRRYLSPKPELTERELAYLVDIDHVHHEALAAVDESDGSFVATARYVQLPDQPHIAEVAIEVADDAQRQGVGTQLAIQTLQRARANGFTHVTATTLHENAPARALMRALHFRRRADHRYEIEFGLELHQPESNPQHERSNHAPQRHQDPGSVHSREETRAGRTRRNSTLAFPRAGRMFEPRA